MSGLLRRLAVAGVLALAALPARAETLTDALIAAYKTSNLLDQNRALLRAADEDVAAAFAALRPVLNYAIAANRNYGGITAGFAATLSLTTNIVLYDFGRNRLAVDLAKETVLATREALVGIEQNVLFSAVQVYMDVIRTREFISLRQNNVRLISENLRAANDRFQLGGATRTDVSLAEARLALARANLAAAEGDYQTARERYRAVTGHYPGTLRQPPAAPVTAKTLEQATAIALRTHPSIKQAQRQVSVNELAIQLALAAMGPTVTAGAQASVNDSGNKTQRLTLQLSGPIYQGGRLSAQYRQAVDRRDSARASLLEAANQVQANVGVAWIQVRVARAQLSSSDEQIRASDVAYRGVQEEAKLGERTTLDVLDAEQSLLDAQTSRVSAYVTLYTANYAVLREMGLLTVEHLQLGIPTYDPEGYYNAVKSAPIRKISPQGRKLDRVLQSLGRK